MEEELLHDAEFVDELPDHLSCAICTLVLIKPIQLASCGHRFCTECFEKLKNYSIENNSELLCPVDRNAVDTNKIFEDKGIERMTFDLQVKCLHSSLGCTWIGELRELKAHFCHKCKFEDERNTKALVKELKEQVDEFKRQLDEKNNQIIHLNAKVKVLCDKNIVYDEKFNTLEQLCNDLQKQLHETRTELKALNLNRNKNNAENKNESSAANGSMDIHEDENEYPPDEEFYDTWGAEDYHPDNYDEWGVEPSDHHPDCDAWEGGDYHPDCDEGAAWGADDEQYYDEEEYYGWEEHYDDE